MRLDMAMIGGLAVSGAHRTGKARDLVGRLDWSLAHYSHLAPRGREVLGQITELVSTARGGHMLYAGETSARLRWLPETARALAV